MLSVFIFVCLLATIILSYADQNNTNIYLATFYTASFFLAVFMFFTFIITLLIISSEAKFCLTLFSANVCFDMFMNINRKYICKLKKSHQYKVVNKVIDGQVFAIRGKKVKLAKKEEHPPQESPEDAAHRRLILGNFNCPYLKTMGSCSFKDCYFSHPKEPEDQRVILSQHQPENKPKDHFSTTKDLPSYLCTDHLVNTITCATQPESVCPNGLHPSNLDDLLNLPAFESRHEEEISSYYDEDKEIECSVCLESILGKVLSYKRWFALFEKCNHPVCADCAKSWAKGAGGRKLPSGAVTCPICRQVSLKYLFSKRFTMDENTKASLFSNN